MDIFTINQETCTKCGACAAVCHLPIIAFQQGSYPRPYPEAERFCSRCAACMIVCPTQSLIHRDIAYEQCPPVDETLRVSYDHCAQLLKGRRSVRSFKDRPVPRDIVAQAMDAARYSPTGSNVQNVQWLVIDDPDKIRRFRELGNVWMLGALRNSPVMAPLADLAAEGAKAGMDYFLRGAPVIVSAYARRDIPINVIVCSIALAYFDLAAISLGLGCYWDGFFTGAANSFAPIKEAIQLPDGYQIYGSLALGHPKYRYLRIPVRKPANISWQ